MIEGVFEFGASVQASWAELELGNPNFLASGVTQDGGPLYVPFSEIILAGQSVNAQAGDTVICDVTKDECGISHLVLSTARIAH